MHQYLTAIGFGDLESKKELYQILDKVEKDFSHQELILEDEEMDYCEFQREYSAGMGIVSFGDMNIESEYRREYYFPYFWGSGITSYADVAIEKRSDREAYVGICEDPKLSINLIFHVQNTLEYLKECQMRGKKSVNYHSVTLAALSNEGVILLPLQKDEHQEKRQQEESKIRMELVNAAKAGDPGAIETLTLEDMDAYSKVSRRLMKEDIFSIVDTTIMPNGVECDKYSIVGTIMDLITIRNEMSDEDIYVMSLEVNNLRFDMCVPVSRVLGEPEIGRRYRGNIWLQGRINF